jgi:hypothetical protein
MSSRNKILISTSPSEFYQLLRKLSFRNQRNDVPLERAFLGMGQTIELTWLAQGSTLCQAQKPRTSYNEHNRYDHALENPNLAQCWIS